MNWTCNTCGMSAGRKTSVIRHIYNPNIHNGNGRAVPLGTYRAMPVNRTNQPQLPSRINSIASDGTGDIRVRIEKEVENLIIKEVAKKIFDSLPNNHATFINLEIVAKEYINEKTSKGLLGEIAKVGDGVL